MCVSILFLSVNIVLLATHCQAVMYAPYATPHRAPWLAYVWSRTKNNGTVRPTSGILVHPRFVLISARRCKE